MTGVSHQHPSKTLIIERGKKIQCNIFPKAIHIQQKETGNTAENLYIRKI
jgi:hypothetical protein